MVFWLWMMTAGFASPQLELTLGADDPDIYFGMGTRLAADDQGTLFVLDPAAHRIAVFDAAGKLQFHFGAKGNGPGEFVEPAALVLSPAGELVVFDTARKRRMVFDRQGRFQRGTFFEAGIVAIREAVVFGTDHSALVAAKVDEAGRPIYDLSIYDAHMKVVQSLARVSVTPLNWAESNRPGFWVGFLKQQFELLGQPMPVVAGLVGDRLVFGRINRYQLEATQGDRAVGRITSRDVQPLVFSEAAREAALKQVWHALASENFLAEKLKRPVFEQAKDRAELPAVMPVIHRLLSWEKGFVVLYNYHPLKRSGTLAFHDANGRLLGEAPFDGVAEFVLIAADKLYSVGENEAGDIVVQRFALTLAAR